MKKSGCTVLSKTCYMTPFWCKRFSYHANLALQSRKLPKKLLGSLFSEKLFAKIPIQNPDYRPDLNPDPDLLETQNPDTDPDPEN